MPIINLKNYPNCYHAATKTFSISEKGIPFATEYELFNPKTSESKLFVLEGSTGPEFDPNTKWIYKHESLTLEVCNDAQITKERVDAYLDHKLNREDRYLSSHN